MTPETRNHKRTAVRTIIGLAGVLVLCPARDASAREARVLTGREWRELVAGLSERSEERRLAALNGLAEASLARVPMPDRASAARAVAKMLEGGASDPLTDRALELLGALEAGAPEVASRVEQYTHHRRAAARALAYAALGVLAGEDGRLRQRVAVGLGDMAPEVRAAAARALERLRAREATERLLRALGRGVAQAAVTLGAVGDAASVARYSALLTQQPLDVMLSGYRRYLLRPDLEDPIKLEIVARLEDVAGPEVSRFLAGIAREPGLRPAVKQAALSATLRIGKALRQQGRGDPQPSAAGPAGAAEVGTRPAPVGTAEAPAASPQPSAAEPARVTGGGPAPAPAARRSSQEAAP